MVRSRWIPAAVTAVVLIVLTSLPTALAAPGGPGQTLITVHPVEWHGYGPNTTLVNGLDVGLLSTTTPGPASAAVSPDLLTSWSGRRMRLVEVQFCYDATHAGLATDVTMTHFFMRIDRNLTGTTKTNPVFAIDDTTPRTDEACRAYSVGWVLGPGDMAAVSVSADFGIAEEYFEIGRLTFVLESTNTPT
jgi:hypothetical protein